MKRNLGTTLVIILLVLITTISGCNPTTDTKVSISPSPPLLTSTVIALNTATPATTSTVTVENDLVVTLTATPTMTPTVVASATPLAATEQPKFRICVTTPRVFDVAQTLDIRDYAHLSFQGENTILFDGWAPRPAPQNAQGVTAPVTSSSDSLVDIPSARILFQVGQIDLESNTILSRTLDISPPLNNLADILGIPLDDQWPLEQISDRVDVIGQSPDEQWQLVQVSDWSVETNGIWLMSQGETYQIVPYVPPSSMWDWADDSSTLWYVHHTPEFGADSVIIHLEHPAVINRSGNDPENFLDATYYHLAFSPMTETVLSIGDPSELGVDTDELFIIDANDNNLQSVQTMPGITIAVWNQATQSFILMIQADNSTNLVDLDGSLIVQAPNIMSPFVFALSPSNHYLAIGYGSAGIWVYECNE